MKEEGAQEKDRDSAHSTPHCAVASTMDQNHPGLNSCVRILRSPMKGEGGGGRSVEKGGKRRIFNHDT